MFAKRNEIKFLDAKPNDEAVPPSQPIPNLRNAIAIDFDYESSMIYYSDIQANTISRVDIYGNNNEAVVSSKYAHVFYNNNFMIIRGLFLAKT